ncbi:MAG: Export-related chaperone CsaA [Candidatus Nomurabacteria bacterium GW2011_GWA1_37_20]|uniref:Export-related chaperone CsaA n=2 Tax=Parcubacteria group TaxID=1794811 RepID=A0A0G0JUG6_9BACT|nr:MAG: Export-related chaperone CsaA [Candidatus Nomurabacteria bacterium GW2011_GWA1_37_20]
MVRRAVTSGGGAASLVGISLEKSSDFVQEGQPRKYMNQITYSDFEKVDIRVGKIIEILDFPEAHKPAYKLKIDFGSEIGIKQSSVQAVGTHTKEELLNSFVCCVVNFSPKKIGPFTSEVLTLGFRNNAGIGWVLIEPKNNFVDLGSKLA